MARGLHIANGKVAATEADIKASVIKYLTFNRIIHVRVNNVRIGTNRKTGAAFFLPVPEEQLGAPDIFAFQPRRFITTSNPDLPDQLQGHHGDIWLFDPEEEVETHVHAQLMESIAVETKQHGKSLSKDQKKWRDRWISIGRYVVVRELEDLKACLAGNSWPAS